MHLTSNKTSNQAGDTIVEVLISITIVSLVLTTCYAISNRALKQGIVAREHTEALYLAQGQIEMLKYREQKSTQATFAPFVSNDKFLFDKKDAAVDTNPVSDWQPQTNTDINNLASGYNADCIKGRYYINIGRGPTTTDPPTYLVTVKWESINGGIDQSQIYYRF